jgi:hypothetical protein
MIAVTRSRVSRKSRRRPVAFRPLAHRVWIAGAVACGAAALLAVHFALLHTYWDYSEGVYALTAQEMLHGGDLPKPAFGLEPKTSSLQVKCSTS